MSTIIRHPARTITALTAVMAIVAFGWFVLFGPTKTANAISSVSGTVYAAGAAYTAESVEVCFFGQTGGNCTMTEATTGSFSVALNAGRYRGKARPSFESVYAPSMEVEIDVFSDQTTTVNLNLSTLQMKGRLTKPDGTGARGNVNVHSTDFSIFSFSDANDDGYYKLGGLPAGTYVAEAMPPFDATGLTSPTPANVTLADGSVVTQNFQYVAASKSVTGSVKKSDGSTAQANVDAFKMNSPGGSNTHTDVSGNFTLSLSGGSWNVQINPDPNAGCVYTEPPAVVNFADDTSVETKTVNFICETTSSVITGTVADSSGNAVTSGNIDARTQDGRGMGTQISSTGTFTLNVKAGTYELFLWTPSNDKMLPPTKVTIGDNETKTLNLVVITKQAKIRGRVTTVAGAAAGNVEVNTNMINLQQTSGGPGGWSNTRTDASGNYELSVTSGTWGVHLGMSPDSNFVPTDMKPCDISVPTETSVVTSSDYSCLDMVVQVADATITGRVMDGATNQPVTQFPGCAFARAIGSFNENCSPINNGTFTIKVSTSVATQWEVGCHTPPNSDRSCASPQKVVVASNGTAQVDLMVMQNNSSISGKIVDSSGFPMASCADLHGMVFADSMGMGSHYQGEVQSDCGYTISLVAGTYQIGTNFDSRAGVMSKPPSPEDQVIVLSGQSVQRNIVVTKTDAKITGVFLGPDGKPTQGYVFAENRQEMDDSRKLGEGGKGQEAGFSKKMPCGAQDKDGVIKCCKDKKNKKQCEQFPIPDGPNGCTNAYTCVQECTKNPTMCEEADKGQRDEGPMPGQDFVGPGGCKSETECKTYCSKPENMTECQKFTPPAGAMSVRVGTKVKATAESKAAPGDKAGPMNFDNMIRAGGPTGPDGKFELNVLSGHTYQVGGGLPPESGGMPPKEVKCDLTKTKTCNVVLQARTSDSTIEGKVTIGKNTPADRCFVHSWAEDGGFSGTPCNPGGQYKLNVTKGTTWHVGADSFDGSTFYRSDEQNIVLESAKKVKLDLILEEGKFRVPEPVTTNFTCTNQTSLSLDNGTTLNIPASAVSSDDGTCSITATPTVNTGSANGKQRVGVAYEITARDPNGQVVSDLQQPVSVKLMLENGGLKEEGISDSSALIAANYDDSTQSYTTETDATVSEQENGDVSLTFSTDHFSAYTALNGGGTASKLKTVTTATSKGKTSFTVNGKKVTPFTTKGTVTVKTALVGSTQVIVAASSAEKTIKLYNVSGKLTKKINGAFPVQTLLFGDDVTKNAKADIVVSSANSAAVKVYDISGKKPAAYNVSVPAVAASGTVKTVVSTVNLGTGVKSLAASIFDTKNKPLGKVLVYDFSKKSFKTSKSALKGYLKASAGKISYSVPTPVIKNLTPKTVSSSNSAATFKLIGKNFEPDTSVQICDSGAAVTFKSTTQLNLVFNATDLDPGKCALTVTNSNGDGAYKSRYVTVQ